jgi:hypothetical protein
MNSGQAPNKGKVPVFEHRPLNRHAGLQGERPDSRTDARF